MLKIGLSVSKALNEHLDGDLPNFQAEYRTRTKSGDWKWISVRGKVVQRDTDGRPVRMLGTSHDITDRKRAEEEIREQREFLNTVVESLSHPFYVINADDYTIELANRATMLTSTEEKRPAIPSCTIENARAKARTIRVPPSKSRIEASLQYLNTSITTRKGPPDIWRFMHTRSLTLKDGLLKLSNIAWISPTGNWLKRPYRSLRLISARFRFNERRHFCPRCGDRGNIRC